MHVSGFNNNVQFQILYEIMYLQKQIWFYFIKITSIYFPVIECKRHCALYDFFYIMNKGQAA